MCECGSGMGDGVRILSLSKCGYERTRALNGGIAENEKGVA